MEKFFYFLYLQWLLSLKKFEVGRFSDVFWFEMRSLSVYAQGFLWIQ